MCRETMWIFMSFLLICIISFECNFGQVANVREFKYKHLYRPLRITPFYEDLYLELNKKDVQLLKDTVHNVILYIKKILSVIPVEDPLLLSRDACRSSWIHGRNVGKCASIKKGYSGEYCRDNFNIPDDHLDGFYTWTNKPLPGKTWFMEGNGIKNTDFVLYIRALTTPQCRTNFAQGTEHSLVAYATFCKLGKNDRPLAGYMNFCPTEFVKLKNDTNKLILTTLHEVFHALGFSKDLFLKYKDCSLVHPSEECPSWDSPLDERHGQKMLLTPEVVYQMQKNFDCNERDFGGPLATRNGILSSHWNEKILPGSVMTSRLGKPEFTYVDPVTLAVFQDSGWYLVNFSNAETYMWGRDKGCDIYGEQKETNTNTLVCSTDETYCNPLHTHVMKSCDSDAIDTFQAAIFKDCRYLLNDTRTGTFNEAHAYRSEYGRCLLTNITLDEEMSAVDTDTNDGIFNQGLCVNVKCFKTGEVLVKLNSPNWVRCPFGQAVEIDTDNGFVMCPESADDVCHHRGTPLYLQELYKIETTSMTVRTVPIIPNTSQSYIIDSSSRRRDRNYSNISHRIHQLIAQVQFVLLVTFAHLTV